jgi:integrase/recombinase XerD
MQTSRVLSQAEEKALLAQPNTDYPVELRNLAILQLFLKHGLRLSEQLSLKWEHTDLSSGTIYISGSNGIRDRHVQLSGRTKETVTAWKRRQASEIQKRVFARDTGGEPEYVLTNLKGGRITRRYIRRMVNGNGNDADIDGDVTINTLRKTFASNLYDKTENIRQVQKALGHEDLSTTMMFTGIVPSQLKQEPLPEMFNRQHRSHH